MRKIGEISAHVCWSHGYALNQFLTHLLHFITILKLVTHLVTHLRNCLMLIFFQPFTGAIHHFKPTADGLFHILCHICIRHFDAVYICLMDKEFLDGNLFRDRAIWIPTPLDTLHGSLHTHILYIRLQDCLIANNPDHLVNDTMNRNNGVRIRRSH